MSISKVLVMGMGQMGSGIIQVCAQAGSKVYTYDVNPEARKRGLAGIEAFLEKGVQKGKVTPEQKEQILKQIEVIDQVPAGLNVDLVIEAVVEDMGAKQKVWADLDKILPERTIFGTCTSALPITEMGSVTKRRNKFIGIHYHQPPQLMKLVEIIRGTETDDETYQVVYDYIVKQQKTPVTVKDVPGFITNRVGMPMTVEAIRALSEGIATAEDIDTAFRDGMGYPLGPLELCDFVGLDTMLHIMEDLYASFGDPKFFPPPLIKKLVSLGYLGRKSGRGFYDYSQKK